MSLDAIRLGQPAGMALLLALAPLAQAQNTAYQYSTQLSINDQLFEDMAQGGLDGTQLPMGSTLSLPNGDTVEARASVGLGVNKAVARILTLDPAQPVRLVYALSKANWWDSVTISDPLRDGEMGQFTTTLLVNGSGQFSATGDWATTGAVDLFAQWRSEVTVYAPDLGSMGRLWAGAWKRNGAMESIEYVGDPINDFQQQVSFAFIYGQPFTLGTQLSTYLVLDNPRRLPGTLDATLDLGNSAYWGGMTIRDLEGNVVEGATLASDSGLDWRLPVGAAAVPEPGAALSMLLGIAALGWWLRRRGAPTDIRPVSDNGTQKKGLRSHVTP